MKDVLTGRNKKVQFLINTFVPRGFRLVLNPGRRVIVKFIQKESRHLSKGSKVLDAGAGPCPYKCFFNHCDYEATDFINNNKILDFVCSLDNIPKKDQTYDAIISTEVLEHVSNPQKVVDEFYRVLKNKGVLIMTVPQEWMVHQEPYNFFYFTKYGLKSLLDNAGFKEYNIIPKGGFFWMLADTLRFNGILEQYKKYFFKYIALNLPLSIEDLLKIKESS